MFKRTVLLIMSGRFLGSKSTKQILTRKSSQYLCGIVIVFGKRHLCKLGFDKLGVFHANQISMCLDPHLN